MKNFHLNHYERAFGNWLIDNKVRYIEVDESKRAAFGSRRIKSFDYLLCPPNQKTIIAEVKGRGFKGKTLVGLRGFDCWVSADDVESLNQWQTVFGPTHFAAFIFVYKIQNMDVDFDGLGMYEFDGSRYVFFCIKLQDYLTHMKLRSPRWRTVTLPADKFRKYAIPLQNLNF